MVTINTNDTNDTNDGNINIKFNKECELVIFDLDDTLILDFCNCLAKDAISIINYFKTNNIKIALASLNTNANIILKNYELQHLFDNITHRLPKSDYIKFYDNNDNEGIEEYNKLKNLDKTYMLNKVLLETGTHNKNALFFDNNINHYVEATKIGIKSIHVNEMIGISWNDVIKGNELFNKNSNEKKNQMEKIKIS